MEGTCAHLHVEGLDDDAPEIGPVALERKDETLEGREILGFAAQDGLLWDWFGKVAQYIRSLADVPDPITDRSRIRSLETTHAWASGRRRRILRVRANRHRSR